MSHVVENTARRFKLMSFFNTSNEEAHTLPQYEKTISFFAS